DDLLVDVGRPVPAGHGALQAVHHGLDVLGRHVLGRVDPEPGDAHPDQRAQVVGEAVAHVVVAGGQVAEPDQLAGAHLPGVGPVLDVAVALADVEVLPGVAVRAVAEQVGVGVLLVLGAGAAGAGADRSGAGHVVDDGVHVDLHPGAAAAVHHVGEVACGAAPGLVQPVADRLVILPPGVSLTGQDDVLLRRRHLDGRVPGGAEEVLALPGDGLPAPLEQVDDGPFGAGGRGGGRIARPRCGGGGRGG